MRPETFWKPRSLVLDESMVLSVVAVMLDWRQRFTKADANCVAENNGSWLVGRSATSRVRVPAASSLDGRASVPLRWKKLRRRKKKMIRRTIIARPATLPTTPPTIFGVAAPAGGAAPDEGFEALVVGGDALPVLVPVSP